MITTKGNTNLTRNKKSSYRKLGLLRKTTLLRIKMDFLNTN